MPGNGTARASSCWHNAESAAVRCGDDWAAMATRQRNRTLRLYLTMWENSHPDKKVVSINYISAMTHAAPFCVAMTTEAAPGPSGAEDALDSPPQ